MAKVKSAGLRNYVGRLGGSVYYMNKGQNIGRELAPEVSNPRTPAQMRQRMKWANLVNIYKANRSWMGHLSFETKKQTWSDYNAFMSANIGANPVYLTKGAAENGDAILAPYTMTKGSLPTIGCEYVASFDGFETSIKIETAPEGLTVGVFSQQILDNNPEWQYGDQLSIVLMYKGVAPYPIVVPIEIMLNTGDETPLADIETQFAHLEDLISISDSGNLTIIPSEGVSFGNQAVCVIHSRTTSGRTKVSTQEFKLNPAAATSFREMGTDEQFEYAAASYGVGSDYFLAAGYQDTEGGGGGTFTIRSVTLAYTDPNYQLLTETKTAGQKNFSESTLEGCTNISFTYDVNVDLTGVDPADIVVDFVPTGGTSVNLSEAGDVAITNGKIVVNGPNAAASANCCRVAGVHVITLPDEREASLGLVAF